MKQKTRKIIIFISLLAFPVTLNYFSPYVSVDGAFIGVITGSVIVFLLQFLSGLIFSRSWCGWFCPVAGIGEVCKEINNKNVNIKKLRIIRYSVFFVWFLFLVSGFILAGGINSIDPFHLTERVVSVDEPIKYITYYMVLVSNNIDYNFHY